MFKVSIVDPGRGPTSGAVATAGGISPASLCDPVVARHEGGTPVDEVTRLPP
jgi:hypothetical protein